MKALKFFKIGFFALLLVNLAFIIFILSRPEPHQGPHKKGALKGIIIKELNLNDQQINQFEVLAKKHHQDMMKTNHKLQRVLNTYFTSLETDDSMKNSLNDEINELQMQKLSITYAHFEDIKALCNSEQVKNFPKIVEHAKRLLITRPPRRRKH